MNQNTLLAVDGNSLVHRAFHSMATSDLRTRDGRPLWAVKGFFSLMLGALERTGAAAVVVGFDDSGNSSRKASWPHYKATRKEKPEGLRQQIVLAIELLRSAGVHVVVPAGLEADDVLASAARTAADDGWRTVIVTSDRDSFALVDETTAVLRLINGGVDASPLLNRERLFTLVGVHAHQYREYAAMRGDASDNLTGISGFGAKTAAKLLAEFGTVSAAFADVDSGGGRAAAAIGKAFAAKLARRENREEFARCVEIMTMRTDLDLGLDLRGGGPGCLPLDADRLGAALHSLELTSMRKLATWLLSGSEASTGFASVSQQLAPVGRPADDYAMAATAGSPAARPTWWQDTLF